MKRSILFLIALCSISNLVAQSTSTDLREGVDVRSNSRGLLMNQDLMSVANMGQFSQSLFQYGTARSMAMAGAMTSLGGDGSSMMINPAGLGMYRGGDITITPMVTIQRSDTDGGMSYLHSRGTSTMSLSNFSTVFNVYESSSSPLVTLNLGLGYNKISDLNYSYSFYSPTNNSSIAQLFSRQLTSGEVTLSEVAGNDYPDWNRMDTNLWGAVLGYKTGLTFQSYGPTPSDYNSSSEKPLSGTTSNSPVWTASWIGSDANVMHFFELESEGSVGEYDIAIGGNILNKLYFGFTFGIQSVYQRLDLMYGEEYGETSETLDNELLYSNYNQTIRTSGVGLNLKLGITYRPVDALRIGFAYHTPTWYSLNREYQCSMASASTASNSSKTNYIAYDSPILEDFGDNKWRFNSPSRILVGGSFTIAQRALISFDYQRDWYGGMSVRRLPYDVPSDLYNGIDAIYQNVTTLRMGGEMKLTPKVALRGGYGFSSSAVRNGAEELGLLDSPTVDYRHYFATGIGYSPSKGISFDLTYMYQKTYMTSYSLFQSDGEISLPTLTSSGNIENFPSNEAASSNKYKTNLRQHNIALSMVVRM